MKKISNGLFLMVVILLASSCKKVFEDHPLTYVTEDYIWDKGDQTGQYADNFLTYVYSLLPSGWTNRGSINGVPLECASDDAVPSDPGNADWTVIRGGYSPSVTFDNNWGSSYAGIRNANMFLANYLKVPWADSLRKQWYPAEARVIRAFFYYDLIKRYGGVPLVGNQVFAATDATLLTIQRSSFDSCINYVLSELTAVQDSLRPEASLAGRGSGNGNANGVDADNGRMRKSVVLAIKAKVLLLAASPLFNPSATPDKSYTGYASYDANRWKAAAAAAKAVMDLNMFQLEADRYMLWRTTINKEYVFMRNGFRASAEWSYAQSPVGYQGCRGIVSPTQELVDAFPMKNGKAITDAASGYNPANPYLNRDPRLYQTVFYNGATWLQMTVQTFEGGKDKPNNVNAAPIQTQTGYYLKKFLANDNNNANPSQTNFGNPTQISPWCYIRYAEILLMYAEAQNEASGPDGTVYSAVEAVRQRAGLVPFALPVGLSQTQMRDIIRNERRVEFAFEEQRFWDIRRWKIAKTVAAASLHGVTITKNTNGTFSYAPSTIVTPFYSDAMNLFPVALKETQVNTSMAQNPGY